MIEKILPGIEELWDETLGVPEVKVAIIDGDVDATHPAFRGARLQFIDNIWGKGSRNGGDSTQHGTHVAGIIFGQHESGLKGIAPNATGLILPVFRSDANGKVLPCSQLEMAMAIKQAAVAGAHVINISGGELSESGSAHPVLLDAVKQCEKQNILVVAAAGNDGCACLHIPGALPWVLPVGAMNENGDPLEFSNWGAMYSEKGLLAPGIDIRGPQEGGGATQKSGTSYAAAIVSGLAALLLGIQHKRGEPIHPGYIREALLTSLDECRNDEPADTCRRILKGRLNLRAAYSYINKNKIERSMTEVTNTMNSVQGIGPADVEFPPGNPAIAPACLPNSTNRAQQPEVGSTPVSTQFNTIAGIEPSDCGCGGGEGKKCSCGSKEAPQTMQTQMVFALGTIGYDFLSEARRDSMMQHAPGANLYDPVQILGYLEKNPWEAASVVWTLNMDATPIYAIHPVGPFANEGYARLREFLKDQVKEGAERISVPGVIAGSVQLMSGQVVPVIIPELRCMYNWSTVQLVESISGKAPAGNASKDEKENYAKRQSAIVNFLERTYHELRNLGMTPQERSINYAATNALNAAGIFAEAIKDAMQLDTIEVEPSPVCRPGAECWDVKLIFFDPENQFQRARKVYRYTIDVSEPCPVMVGLVRSWYIK
jgi:cyanobactin maturation PatA/PatG family protease